LSLDAETKIWFGLNTVPAGVALALAAVKFVFQATYTALGAPVTGLTIVSTWVSCPVCGSVNVGTFVSVAIVGLRAGSCPPDHR
jgi:hypothetical protein